MAGFLGGLFERKSAGSRQAVSRAVSQSPSRHGMWGSVGAWDVDKAVDQAYERDLWVYRCIDAIATNQSSIGMVHRKGDARNGRLLQSPQLMTLLNVRPNSYETAAQFRYRLTTLALLSTKGYFIEAVPNVQNPESLHVLPPQSVEPIPDPFTFVSGYRVIGADRAEKVLRPDQVIWGKLKPHPIDPYRQMTPLMSAGISVETDLLARMFNRNFLQNDGRPGLLISVRGQMLPEDAQEIKRRFSGGPQHAGQTSVIEADGMDIADLGATPRDAQWMESINASKEDILLAFGVPESVLGNASGRTFDNADAEYEIFWTHTMKPHCEAMASAFDVFTGDQSDDEVIAYDYSTVDVLQRQERRRQDAIIDRWARGVITWNEMRKEIGRNEWTEALAARIIVLPSGFAMAENGDDQAKIMQLPNVNSGGNPGDAMSEIARQGAKLGAREGARSLNNVLAARALQLAGKEAPHGEGDAVPLAGEPDIVDAVLVNPQSAELKALEATLDGLLIGMSSRQESIVSDRITHAKVRKGTRHWEAEGETKVSKPPYPYKQLDAMYAVEVERWVRETRDDFKSVLSPAIRKEAARVARDVLNVGGDKVSKEQQAQFVEGVLNEVLDIVGRSVRTQSERIAKVIQDRDSDGASIEDIQKEIRRLVGTRSTWRKSLTGHVSNAALEAIKFKVYETDPGIQKTWNTEDDERVRASHRLVDEVTIGVSDYFHVGATMMQHPNDPMAPIEEVANCRCWCTYSKP